MVGLVPTLVRLICLESRECWGVDLSRFGGWSVEVGGSSGGVGCVVLSSREFVDVLIKLGGIAIEGSLVNATRLLLVSVWWIVGETGGIK